MWGFLAILRFILCCEEEEGQYSRDSYQSSATSEYRNINRNENDYGFLRVPNCEKFSRTSSTFPTHSKSLFDEQSTTQNKSLRKDLPRSSSTISTHSKSQSCAQATTTIQSQSRLNSSTTSCDGSNWLRNNLSSLDALISMAPETKVVTKDSNLKLEVGKMQPNFEKLKLLPPSSTPSFVSQRTLNPDANKGCEPKLFNDSSSVPPQSSPSSRPPQFAPKPAGKPSPSSTGPTLSFFKPDSSSSSSSSCSSPPGIPPISPNRPRVSNKPILSQASFNPKIQQKKTNYIRVEKGASPIYMIPEDIEDLIKRGIVPGVLKKPLSPSTYQEYFRSLLYAEDYYLEKWDGFLMENVILEVHKAAIYERKGKHKNSKRSDWEEDKKFVVFELDSVPQNRPFLLSRDFASVRPSGRRVEPFQGVIYRVVKSNLVLVEFGEDFHSQHDTACKYDVKFSFNRVCLKRAHQAIEMASDFLFKNFLFPDRSSLFFNSASTKHLYISHKLDQKQASAVRQIYSLHGPPPYLVEGPHCVTSGGQLSRTGNVILEAVLQNYQREPYSRIVICAPTNRTCDVVASGLQEVIPESAIFRANAAFREYDTVLEEILPSCRFEGDCFSCPPLNELKEFKVILSTYMSCFRLHNEGLAAGHFNRMFLLDVSLTTEPETLVALANLADQSTGVVVTGALGSCSRWVRSPIARRNGLMRSYFERLYESKLYESLDPKFKAQL